MKINEQKIYLNYDRENKWLGILDYKSLVFLLGYVFLCGYIASALPWSIEIKIYVFLGGIIPVAAIMLVSSGQDNMLDMIKTLLLFCYYRCVFISKEEEKGWESICYQRITILFLFFYTQFLKKML